MTIQALYDIFAEWLDLDAKGRNGYILKKDAPKEAIEALEEYNKIQREAHERGSVY